MNLQGREPHFVIFIGTSFCSRYAGRTADNDSSTDPHMSFVISETVPCPHFHLPLSCRNVKLGAQTTPDDTFRLDKLETMSFQFIKETFIKNTWIISIHGNIVH